MTAVKHMGVLNMGLRRVWKPMQMCLQPAVLLMASRGLQKKEIRHCSGFYTVYELTTLTSSVEAD